jgi:hypothetical protein
MVQQRCNNKDIVTLPCLPFFLLCVQLMLTLYPFLPSISILLTFTIQFTLTPIRQTKWHSDCTQAKLPLKTTLDCYRLVLVYLPFLPLWAQTVDKLAQDPVSLLLVHWGFHPKAWGMTDSQHHCPSDGTPRVCIKDMTS